VSKYQEYGLLELCDLLDTQRKPVSSMERDKIKGCYPYYGASGIVDYVKDYIFSEDSILISEDGENLNTRNTPVAFRAKGKYWVNNHAHVLRPKKEHYFPLIINYVEQIDLSPYITGAVQPKLSQENLRNIRVNLPVEEIEQCAIASVLSSLDDKIELLHRQNKTLEELADAIYRHFFVENNKTDWSTCFIRDLAVHGKESIHPNRQPVVHYFHYSIPAFDKTHMPNQELGLLIQSNKYNVSEKSILFSKLNPHKDKRIWLVPDVIAENSVCSTEFQVLIPKSSKFRFFVYSFLNYPENYDEIAAGVGGTSGSHQRIDPDVIFNFNCFLPDDGTLLNFNSTVDPVFTKMHQNLDTIQTLIQERDLLLPKLMSGEVRVKTGQ
jgi:type I restriction enzyme S subunit